MLVAGGNGADAPVPAAFLEPGGFFLRCLPPRRRFRASCAKASRKWARTWAPFLSRAEVGNYIIFERNDLWRAGMCG